MRCQVYTVKIPPNITENDIKKLLPYVSPQRAEKIKRLAVLNDKALSLYAELLLRHIIADKLKISGSQINFGASQYGKPYLVGINKYKFNISHSLDYVACAVADCEVGVDIQRLQKADILTAKHIFSAEEYGRFLKLPQSRRDKEFFKLWTIKESYLKAIGTGFFTEPKSFSAIKNFMGKYKLISQNNAVFFFKTYNIDNSYMLSVCSVKNSFCNKPAKVDFNEVTELFAKILSPPPFI